MTISMLRAMQMSRTCLRRAAVRARTARVRPRRAAIRAMRTSPNRTTHAQAAEPERPAREETRRQARRPVEQTRDDEEELADYHTDENSYSDDVYEPYDPDEDDSDYEPEGGSPTEWSDGIKRAFSKGRAGWKALKAKANAGGKKHPPQKKKRPPQQRAAAPVKREAPVEEEHEEYIRGEKSQFTPQPAQVETFENEPQPVQPAPRTRVDMSGARIRIGRTSFSRGSQAGFPPRAPHDAGAQGNADRRISECKT